jgi:hypothetical protein
VAGLAHGYRESGKARLRNAVTAYANKPGPLQAAARRMMLNAHLARGDTQAGLSAVRQVQDRASASQRRRAHGQMAKFYLLYRAGRLEDARRALSNFETQHLAKLNAKRESPAISRYKIAQRLVRRGGRDTPKGDVSSPTAKADSVSQDKEKKATESAAVSSVPDEYALRPVAPNPVRTQTTIRYELPERATVRISVYNALGRRVRTVTDRLQAAGYHTAQMEADQLSAGVYLVRMQVGAFARTRRLVVAK